MKAIIYVFEGTPEEVADCMTDYGLYTKQEEEEVTEDVEYTNTKWTEEECDYLLDNYETQTWEELANNLRRTVNAVRSKWNSEDIQVHLEE